MSLTKRSFSFVVGCLFILPSLPASATTSSNTAFKMCALYPHLKDSYWLSVNYGMVEQARKLNVDLRVLEAGGYPNEAKQQEHIRLCVEWKADAILLGTVAPDLYRDTLTQLAGSTPVFATVNKLNLNDAAVSALKGEVGVDWYSMGFQSGQYLAKQAATKTDALRVLLLPGPRSSGGTKPVIEGFYQAIKKSRIEIVATEWADNDKELQRNFVQKAVEDGAIDYIVGSAVAIEAAISELRAAEKVDEIGLVSTYLSHGVYRGLLRHKVEFSPTDKMVEQGRLSVMQAYDYLSGNPFSPVQAPDIAPLTPENLDESVISDSLSPSKYRPVFRVKPESRDTY